MTPSAAALATLIAGWRRKRISLAELRALHDRADPATRGSVDRRRLLAEIVAELVDAGVVTTSRKNDGERTPLPLFLQRVEVVAAPAPKRKVPWHPELAWADGIRPGTDQARLLEAVNRWLFAGGAASRPVPLRERAYEITGDEKAFDRVPLFDGRLTVDVLRSYRPPVPLYRLPVGPGPDLLVVENADTFDSLRRVLTTRESAIGQVAWGAGAAFESSVLSIAEATDDRPAEIQYFGDLDVAGLRIPASASAIAEAVGLPPVRPATDLYAALLAAGRPCPRRSGKADRVPAARAQELTTWLDLQHRGAVAELLERGERLAQEAVGLALLEELNGWPPA